MMEIIQENYQWVFSGIGSGILFWFLGNKNCKKKITKQNIKAGDNSSSIQVGRDYTTTKKED